MTPREEAVATLAQIRDSLARLQKVPKTRVLSEANRLWRDVEREVERFERMPE